MQLEQVDSYLSHVCILGIPALNSSWLKKFGNHGIPNLSLGCLYCTFLLEVLSHRIANKTKPVCCFCCLCLTLCDLMDYSMPGSSVLHYFPEFAQIHVH